jgi:ABC-type Co2+ transport system permease subunit
MAGVHAMIGIGEAVITAAAVSLILGVRPDLLPRRAAVVEPAGRVAS